MRSRNLIPVFIGFVYFGMVLVNRPASYKRAVHDELVLSVFQNELSIVSGAGSDHILRFLAVLKHDPSAKIMSRLSHENSRVLPISEAVVGNCARSRVDGEIGEVIYIDKVHWDRLGRPWVALRLWRGNLAVEWYSCRLSHVDGLWKVVVRELYCQA